MCEAGSTLGYLASAGGGCDVRRYWLRVCPLHKAPETPGQLPGQYEVVPQSGNK